MEQLAFDFTEKTRWDLVPHQQLQAIADVLTHGASKHGDKNYLNLPVDDHYAAAMRHIMEWRRGEEMDPETGANPLIHAICRLMFIAEIDRLGWQENEEESWLSGDNAQKWVEDTVKAHQLDFDMQYFGVPISYLRGGKDFAPESD